MEAQRNIPPALIVEVWAFQEQLDRPDAYLVDAARPHDEIYADIRRYASRVNDG